MNRTISNNTIYPTRITPGDSYTHELMPDFMRLRPAGGHDVLLIVGDGANVLDDLEQWYKIAEGRVKYDTMAVNYSSLIIPHEIQHYAAGDAHMPDMQRMAAKLPKAVLKHAWNPGCPNFDIRWVRNGRGGWAGTSANLAIKIGLAFDYTRIVLAGCPMDRSGNWYTKLIPSNDIKANKDHRHHLWKWTEIATRPIGRFVKSMSGNTKDLFGYPTIEWLTHSPPGNGEADYYSA